MAIHRDARVDRVAAALVWSAMVLVLVMVVLYLQIIRGQGGATPEGAVTVPFVAGYLVLMAVLLWVSVLGHPMLVVLRPAIRAAAAAGLLVMGVIAGFSIGAPILVAGILATIGAIRALAGTNLRTAMLSEIAAAAIAVSLLIGGFAVTGRVIICPPTGTMSGGGSGFLTPAYHYECVNGTLTMHSGDCNGLIQGGINGNPLPGNC